MVEEPTLLAQCRPITCIELTENYVLVCEGPGLSVFSKNGVKVNQVALFPLDKTILGLSVAICNDGWNLLFAFGRRYCAVYHCDRSFLKISSAVICEDGPDPEYLRGSTYIAARWLEGGQKLAALTDENILHVYEWHFWAGGRMIQSSVRKIIRGVQTTLFSAAVSGTCEDDLLVFSGTNLSQIYVWSPKDLTKNYHILVEGIKGSVLSLMYSTENQILVASSDQRSVFAWKLESSDESVRSGRIAFAFSQNLVTISLLAEMIGHTGRVWQVDILNDHIVSAGQDSNLLLWETNGRLKKMFSGPTIVNIRCCRFDSNGRSVLSGSDDGSVCRWNLSDPFFTSAVELLPIRGSEGGNDYARQVKFYNDNQLLISMNSGKIVVVGKGETPTELFRDQELTSYNTFAVSSNRRYLTIGSKTGWLYIIGLDVNLNNGSVSAGSFLQKNKFDSKIVSVHFADDLVVVSTCTMVHVLQLRENRVDFLWEEIENFKINWKEKPGVSAAVTLKPDSEIFLVLGDEIGNLHVFTIGQESDSALFSLPKLHGPYGVCDLKKGIVSNELWSVGRNRLIINLKLQLHPHLSLNIIQTVESCLNWNAKLVGSPLGTFICGFSENDFVILDLVEDRVVKKFPCGGAHRSWDITVDSLFSFAFIRHKQLTLSVFGLDSTNIQNGVFGGKTINVITVCPGLIIHPNKEGCETLGILTAGEDAFLRFSRVSVQLSKIEGAQHQVTTSKISKFKNHASSVRVIKYHYLKGNNALQIFSGGGRSQIVASFLQCRNNNVTWTKQTSTMLLTAQNSKKECTDPDMRIMDISIEKEQEGQYKLVCACSDGYLRLVRYHRQRFFLLHTFNQGQSDSGELHAITQVHSFNSSGFVYGSNSVGQLMYSSCSRNEKESLDSTSSLLKLEKINDAGITSLAVIKGATKRKDLIISGSDDGVLKAFEMLHSGDCDEKINSELVLLFEDRTHHSAAINSVIVTDNNLVLAASADQIVTFRKLDGSVLKSFRCGVNDVQSMAAAELPYGNLLLLLVGQGFETRILNYTK